MDDPRGADLSDEMSPTTIAIVEETSTEFLGRWNLLVSTTNWEKGRIIADWRQRLIDSEAPLQAYSDEAWSRRVGNVSGQHAGRLRRVWDRFGENYQQFDGLYWSHFQAALDWEDAEMYLEGAVQSGWSVAQMRAQRWEAMGAPADDEPDEEDIVAAEFDEDAGGAGDVDTGDPANEDEPSGELDGAEGSEFDAGADGDDVSDDPPFDVAAGPIDESDSAEAADPVRPFEDLPPLPDDLNEAFEALKIAIVSHKVAKWQEVSADDVLAHLDAVKILTASEQ